MKKFLLALAKGIGTGILIYILFFMLQILLSNIEFETSLELFAQALELLLQPGFMLKAAVFAGGLVMVGDLLENYEKARNIGLVTMVIYGCIGLMLSVGGLQDELHSLVHQEAKEKAVQEAKDNLILEGSQTFTFDGLPIIQVVSSEPVDYDYLQSIVNEAVATQPAFLLEKCSTIILMDPAAFEKDTGKSTADGVVGLSSSADMSIRILMQNFEGPYIDTSIPDYVMEPMDYYINTITHELAHLYDYQSAYNQTFVSDDPAFQVIYETYPQNIGEYGASNIREFFAEGSKLYLLYPNYLMNHCWPLYEYLHKLRDTRKGWAAYFL